MTLVLSKIFTNFVDLTFTSTYFVVVKKILVVIFASTKSFVNRILSNETIIYDFDDEAIDILQKIVKFFLTLWEKKNFVKLLEKNWMRISLKFDWESRVFEKVKVYSLETRDKTLVNKIFDALHKKEKLSWINEFTSFSFLMFCVWKNDAKDNSKRRVVVDIRELNAIS